MSQSLKTRKKRFFNPKQKNICFLCPKLSPLLPQHKNKAPSEDKEYHSGAKLLGLSSGPRSDPGLFKRGLILAKVWKVLETAFYSGGTLQGMSGEGGVFFHTKPC